jgi:TNF receptor-associated protein 1
LNPSDLSTWLKMLISRRAITSTVTRVSHGIRSRSSLQTPSSLITRSLSTSAPSSSSSSTSSTSSSSTPPPPVAPVESTVGPAETHGFQTETKQLLNIVANALYTDKHVFVRWVYIKLFM